jgi:hypothetical protein
VPSRWGAQGSVPLTAKAIYDRGFGVARQVFDLHSEQTAVVFDGRAAPGTALDVAEESWMRAGGGAKKSTRTRPSRIRSR